MTLIRLRVNDIRVSLRKEKTLKECVADKLGVRQNALQKVQVLHRAVDARRKNNICTGPWMRVARITLVCCIM